MRRVALFALVLLAAGCGGTHSTEPANTGSRNVTKPFQRPLVVDLGNATVRLRRVANKTTLVTLEGKTGGATLELASGSCSAPKGLKTIRTFTGDGPWTIAESLTALTAAPLAGVLRHGGTVAACRNVRQA